VYRTDSSGAHTGSTKYSGDNSIGQEPDGRPSLEEVSREIDSSAIQHYELSVLELILSVRQHRDFDRWAEEVTALQSEFEGSGNLLELWDALIASRNYPAAENLLHTMPDDYQRTNGVTLGKLTDRVSHQADIPMLARMYGFSLHAGRQQFGIGWKLPATAPGQSP
jgi:hypothetical protein